MNKKKIIELFYWGKNYEILKKNINNQFLSELNNLIVNLNEQARKIYQNKKNSPNLVKSKQKESVLKEDKSKIKIDNKGFIKYFDNFDYELVLKIVEQFKVTNPNYYEVITKKYSGENLDIVINKLDRSEYQVINTAIKKIKNLLENPDKLNKYLNNMRGFLNIYDPNEYEIILKIIDRFKVTNPNYYEVITKKYSGKNLEITNCKLNKDEQVILSCVREKIKNLLSDSIKMDEFFNTSPGFLKLFEKNEYEIVLKIVEQFKVTNPNYYEVITKRYSGKNLETINCKLNKDEQIVLNNAIVKIRKILKKQSSPIKQIGFLKFFEEKNYENVLKIVEQFKVTNPNYYEVITKKYSGENLEVVNNINLSIQEQRNLYDSIRKIKHIITNFDEEISNLKKSKNNSSKLDDEIIDELINSLDIFSNKKTIQIIKLISKYYPNKIKNIINSNYMKTKMNYLTDKEKLYIYLTLLSYSKPSLTHNIISNILGVDLLDLENYQIMTSNDDVNELNKLLIKQKNR